MHYIAPIPIIFGVIGAEDGGPETGLFFLFGFWYIGMRVMKQLFSEPMSVLPALGILIASTGLIWLGIVML